LAVVGADDSVEEAGEAGIEVVEAQRRPASVAVLSLADDAGLAQSPAQLVGARLLKGLTAAAMVPQVLALIAAVFPASERPRALAWFGVTMGVGAVAGQVLGGLLLDANLFGLGWRVIFLVNVPIAITAATFAQRLLPAARVVSRTRVDFVGMVGVSGSLALALVPLALGRTEGWPLWMWASFIAATPVMGAAALWEWTLVRRGGQPLLDLALFRDAVFNWGLVVNVAVFGSFFGFLFTLTLVMQDGLGLTPLQAGLAFAPLGVAFAVASITAKQFIVRHGGRVITMGTAIAAVGLLALVVVLQLSTGAASAPHLIGPMVIVGLGNGISVPALIGAVLAGIRAKQAGAAAGVLTTSQQFASAAGVAGLGSIFFQVLGTRTGVLAYVSALQWSAAFSVLLVVAASVMSTRLPRPTRDGRQGSN